MEPLIFLSLFPKRWEYRHIDTHLFLAVLGIKSRASYLGSRLSPTKMYFKIKLIQLLKLEFYIFRNN